MSKNDEDIQRGEMVERPDLFPAPVNVQEPAKFRGLYRRNFSRAMYAHAALEQFQLEVAGLRGRLVHFMKLLEGQVATPPSELASMHTAMQFLAAQDPEPPLSANAVIGRINSFNRRIVRLADIVKFARSRLSAEAIPIEILPSRHVFTSTYRRLDGMPLDQLREIQRDTVNWLMM